MRRLALLPAVLVLAACGGGSARHGRTVTLPAYAGFPATTIVGVYSASACRADARAFAREGKLVVAHTGAAAAYSSDTYLIDITRFYYDFQARDCDPADLGRALRRALTPAQRRVLVANLPNVVAQTVRDGLAHAG